MVPRTLDLGLTIGEAAGDLGVTRQHLECLINERVGVSPEMVLHVTKVFGGTAELWLRLKAAFDLTEIGDREAKDLATMRCLAKVSDSV